MPHSPARIGRPALGDVTRSKGLLRCAALLACAAVLIAVSRLGLFDLHNEVAGWIGLSLAVLGALYLLLIWRANRYRVSIGRFMVIVAMLAVLLQVILTLRQRELARIAPKPPGAASSNSPR